MIQAAVLQGCGQCYRRGIFWKMNHALAYYLQIKGQRRTVAAEMTDRSRRQWRF